ncbi:hypothetical protein ABW08_22995 [Pluralibacter gergoviae]|uniref:glycosyltransferase family 2 protein n=1 Tax=Pluralibacter gergoviae TaxID=61647 RepID=UPI0006517240|nr:glycosyltransferase family 2 protein [Pluralibacter gergoviae]KMK01533.1 hypothetical protein ABW08_22995 [Pluralibacter gergoviae]
MGNESTIKTGCVVVTFNPDIKHLQKFIKVLTGQSDSKVYLIDNNSTNKEELFTLKSICSTTFLDFNSGIAHAQNIGIKKAIEDDMDYIIFFDQDSYVDSNFVLNLTTEMVNLEKNHNVATLGPIFKDARYGFYYDVIKLNKFGFRKKIKSNNIDGFQEVSFIISSGSIVSRKAIDIVGLMDERFFIDYVDTEWCLRSQSKKLHVFVTSKVTMTHAIGDKFIKFFKYNIPVHSSFRRYYRIRNAFYFFRMPHIPIVMKVRDVLYNTVHQSIIIMKVEDRLNQAYTFFRAVRDGLSFVMSNKKGRWR